MVVVGAAFLTVFSRLDLGVGVEDDPDPVVEVGEATAAPPFLLLELVPDPEVELELVDVNRARFEGAHMDSDMMRKERGVLGGGSKVFRLRTGMDGCVRVEEWV